MTALATNAGPSRWWHSRAARRFMNHHLALLGLALISLLTLACIFGPYLLPYDSLYIDLRARFAPPLTGDHYFGTDPLGRDVAARLFMAGRISLLVGFFAMLLSTLVGTVVGVIAGDDFEEISEFGEIVVRDAELSERIADAGIESGGVHD
jgi:peptide/nickel transport system permease protein